MNATIESVHLGAAGEPLSRGGWLHADTSLGCREAFGGNGGVASQSEFRSPLHDAGVERGTGATAPSDNVSMIDELKARMDELHASSERSFTCSRSRRTKRRIAPAPRRCRATSAKAWSCFSGEWIIHMTAANDVSARLSEQALAAHDSGFRVRPAYEYQEEIWAK